MDRVLPAAGPRENPWSVREHDDVPRPQSVVPKQQRQRVDLLVHWTSFSSNLRGFVWLCFGCRANARPALGWSPWPNIQLEGPQLLLRDGSWQNAQVLRVGRGRRKPGKINRSGLIIITKHLLRVGGCQAGADREPQGKTEQGARRRRHDYSNPSLSFFVR